MLVRKENNSLQQEKQKSTVSWLHKKVEAWQRRGAVYLQQQAARLSYPLQKRILVTLLILSFSGSAYLVIRSVKGKSTYRFTVTPIRLPPLQKNNSGQRKESVSTKNATQKKIPAYSGIAKEDTSLHPNAPLRDFLRRSQKFYPDSSTLK